jgi:hypothetical protein
MTETARLKLPLVQAAQAQKHVTVNEALLRVDALAQPVIASRSVAVPPPVAPNGALYAVPAGASGPWAGQAGRLALSLNGGWDFVDPVEGWRAWIADEGVAALHDGTDWVASAAAVSPGGAALAFRVIEIDQAVSAGASSATLPIIPQGALVFGVTGRVLAGLGGTATGLAVGVAGAADRYGSCIGTGAGAWFRGVTGTPVAYYADTALLLSAEGGDFGGGAVRLAVHVAELGLPRP